ncbi:cupin domain-containing protein [uncultured Algibacter sp.]|uniref:cupin domain-containing protein n=1 Tax=uncultured Algibacter sp. TaxID=298659 RepID=UPI002632371D|nr:cupin domain-containing protein [uncultured Algibacter sp.]
MTKIEQIVNKLQLAPHPEGGFFKEVYRSKEVINKDSLNSDFSSERNYSTSIYFLLTSNSFSAFHRINQDEIWHFYKGSPIKLHIISQEGDYWNVIIGSNIENDELLQYTVLAKHWFAAEVIKNDNYSLVGCTVAPGFDFKDFELANRSKLISIFPQHENIITKLTRI